MVNEKGLIHEVLHGVYSSQFELLFFLGVSFKLFVIGDIRRLIDHVRHNANRRFFFNALTFGRRWNTKLPNETVHLQLYKGLRKVRHASRSWEFL
jgi:hypothetical protein